jgi:hypothetical protein
MSKSRVLASRVSDQRTHSAGFALQSVTSTRTESVILLRNHKNNEGRQAHLPPFSLGRNPTASRKLASRLSGPEYHAETKSAFRKRSRVRSCRKGQGSMVGQ